MEGKPYLDRPTLLLRDDQDQPYRVGFVQIRGWTCRLSHPLVEAPIHVIANALKSSQPIGFLSSSPRRCPRMGEVLTFDIGGVGGWSLMRLEGDIESAGHGRMLRYFHWSGAPGSFLVTHDYSRPYEPPPAKTHDAHDYAEFETFMKTMAVKYKQESVVFRTPGAAGALTFRMLRFALSDEGENTGEVTSCADFTAAFSGSPPASAQELKNLAQVMAALQRAHEPDIGASTERAGKTEVPGDTEPDRSGYVLDGFKEKWRPGSVFTSWALSSLRYSRRHEWCVKSYYGGELLADGLVCPICDCDSMNRAKHIANEFGEPVIFGSMEGPGPERPEIFGRDPDAHGREYRRHEFLVEPNAGRWKA